MMNTQILCREFDAYETKVLSLALKGLGYQLESPFQDIEDFVLELAAGEAIQMTLNGAPCWSDLPMVMDAKSAIKLIDSNTIDLGNGLLATYNNIKDEIFIFEEKYPEDCKIVLDSEMVSTLNRKVNGELTPKAITATFNYTSNGILRTRYISVRGINETVVAGLDRADENKFKKFLWAKISDFRLDIAAE